MSVGVDVVLGRGVSTLHAAISPSTKDPKLNSPSSGTAGVGFDNAGPVEAGEASALSVFGGVVDLGAPPALGITVRRWRGLKTQGTLARSQRTHGFDDPASLVDLSCRGHRSFWEWHRSHASRLWRTVLRGIVSYLDDADNNRNVKDKDDGTEDGNLCVGVSCTSVPGAISRGRSPVCHIAVSGNHQLCSCQHLAIETLAIGEHW